MKTKSLFILFLAAVLLLCHNITEAKNNHPKTKIEKKTIKPKKEKEEFCYVRGVFEQIREGETVFYVCRLVSTAKCVSIPCNVWGPFGPNNSKAVVSGPIPENLQIDGSRPYIVKYKENGATEVQYVNGIKIEETDEAITIHYY